MLKIRHLIKWWLNNTNNIMKIRDSCYTTSHYEYSTTTERLIACEARQWTLMP